ncbi:late histone H2B.L4-like [Phalaenopsis equestris]|uniref:late histone H2B.L4-like n=1 Tax=Phalaenopsis equestris TaxID=78828 RepID=UPI0009E23DE9|nr:late histone H2B.L4-like [Phalaenopsis equestris]
MAPKRSKNVVGTVVQTKKKVVEEIVKIEVEMIDPEGHQKPIETNKEKETENSEETREENAEKKKRRRKKRRGSVVGAASGGYKRYVLRVMKQVHPGMRVSGKAMSVIEGMMCDMFERIADEAAQLSKYTGKLTLSSKEIQDAVRLIMPGELGKHAISEGMKAVTTYMGK